MELKEVRSPQTGLELLVRGIHYMELKDYSFKSTPNPVYKPWNPLHGVESLVELYLGLGSSSSPGIHYMELKVGLYPASRYIFPVYESITWS